MKKGELTLKILTLTAEAAMTTIDVFAAVLSAGYGASVLKIEKEFSKRVSRRGRRSDNPERVLRQRYVALLSNLKRQGLISGKDELRATKKGIQKIKILKEKLSLMMPSADYKKESSDSFSVISFDIPEKRRKWRDWLREALGNMGFFRVQQSLWMGKVKISKEFISDLYENKLVEFVEIFQITRAGSLTRLGE